MKRYPETEKILRLVYVFANNYGSGESTNSYNRLAEAVEELVQELHLLRQERDFSQSVVEQEKSTPTPDMLSEPKIVSLDHNNWEVRCEDWILRGTHERMVNHLADTMLEVLRLRKQIVAMQKA